MVTVVEVENPIDTVVLCRRMLKAGHARRLRLGAGLSQSEVATAIGCSKSAVGMLERGERKPRTDLARRYGALLATLIEIAP